MKDSLSLGRAIRAKVFLVSLTAILVMSGFFVVAGTASANIAPNGVLGVTQITAIKTLAAADGTYTNGWSWVFDVTVPTTETTLNMKFADWVSGSNVITAGDHIRFYSVQSSNHSDADHAITISAANSYSGEMDLITTDDLSANDGRQIQITVEAAVPVGSAGGSYSTGYGIQSNPDTTAPVITLTGDNPQTIERTSSYVELGATALDNVDGVVVVTPDASAVDTNTVASYTVNYSATDSTGHTATTTRTVNVVANPAEASAETAVAAYETAPITTLTEVTAAEALEAPATTAVALVLDPTANGLFTGRITTQTGVIATAKAALEAAIAQAATDAVAAGITTITAPVADAPALTLPTVPAGYTVAIKTSDTLSVVALDGTITPPATDTTVVLVLTVTNTATSQTADTASINVVVPATAI
ncbi:MAG: DUF5011 domain-containing protein [Candidatus Staskawiczbacteria bacterium]|nr:DUF5011 domain-containing protein [Candidatus Staskawiczbacteria bacterium]